jgi:hypothetical protein
MLLCEVTGKLCFFCAISMAVADTVLSLARVGGLSGVEHFCVLPVAALRHHLSDMFLGYTYAGGPQIAIPFRYSAYGAFLIYA